MCVSAALIVVGFPARAGAASWSEIARVEETRVARQLAESRALVVGDRLAEAEARLRQLSALHPVDAGVALPLAEIQAALKHEGDAVATLERAIGRGGGDDDLLRQRLGLLYTKLGRHAEAAAVHAAAAAAGTLTAEGYTNLAEVLMADGRLPEAKARYRDAIAVASHEVTGERRPRSQDLALAYYGLSVALDRDRQPIAAREAMSRALSLDPGGALLRVAATGDGDLFFVPAGEVFYYLGLAAEVEGRAVDAEAAFREFVTRLPASRWAPRALAHAGREGGPAASVRRARPEPKIVAIGTLETSGGIAAPLVDAAWRDHAGLLDACLEALPASRGSVRFSLEVDLDVAGRVTRASARTGPPLDARFARCVEAAVESKLRVAVPRRSKPTTVRTDLMIAFP